MILNINSAELHTGATLVAMLIAKLFKFDFESQDEYLQQSSYHDEGKNYCCVYGYSSQKDVEKLEEAMSLLQKTCGELLNGSKTDPKKTFGWIQCPRWTFKNTITLNIKFKCARWDALNALELDDAKWEEWLQKLELSTDSADSDDDADY